MGNDTLCRYRNQAAWQDGPYKLFACNNADAQPLRYFLYDLEADPAETVDLSQKLPRQLAKMKAGLAAWIEAVAVSRGPAETNCAAVAPPPSPPTPPAPPTPPPSGPFTPTPGVTNCTYVTAKTMPRSRPIKARAGSAGACCGVCFDTSWCVAAIFEDGSCNMHTGEDVHPLAHGAGVAVLSGRV